MTTQDHSLGNAAVETFGDGADLLWLVFALVVLMPVWLMFGALFLVYALGRIFYRLTAAGVRGYRSAGSTVS